MEPHFHHFSYSLGTVLGGYLFILPAWLVSVLWNKLLPRLSFNPWILPWFLSALLVTLFVTGTGDVPEEPYERWLMALAFIPPLVFCTARWRRYSARQAPEPPAPSL